MMSKVGAGMCRSRTLLARRYARTHAGSMGIYARGNIKVARTSAVNLHVCKGFIYRGYNLTIRKGAYDMLPLKGGIMFAPRNTQPSYNHNTRGKREVTIVNLFTDYASPQTRKYAPTPLCGLTSQQRKAKVYIVPSTYRGLDANEKCDGGDV